MVDFSKYLKVKVDLNMPPDQVNIERNGKVVGSIINLSTDSSLPERNFPLNSVDGSGETQDREEPLSVEACKANLHFYASKKEFAFHAHKQAIIEYEEALTALNNALTQKYFGTK